VEPAAPPVPHSRPAPRNAGHHLVKILETLYFGHKVFGQSLITGQPSTKNDQKFIRKFRAKLSDFM
jgi:hypothetical protein